MPNRTNQAAADNDDGCADHGCHSSIHHPSSAQIRLLFISRERKSRRRRVVAKVEPRGRSRRASCSSDHRQYASVGNFLANDCTCQVARDAPQLARPDHQASAIEMIQQHASAVDHHDCDHPAKPAKPATLRPPAAATSRRPNMRCRGQIVATKLIRTVHLLSVCVLAICLFSSGVKLQETGQSNLPTVIVRGFLNYRTTVDGTVLLFTPDAGTVVQPPSVASSQQPQSTSSRNLEVGTSSVMSSRDITQSQLVLASTQLIGAFEPVTSSAAPSQSEFGVVPSVSPSLTSLGGSPSIEPTSVLATQLDGPTSLIAAGPVPQWQADDPLAGSGRAHSASNEQSGSGNEWHPIQATPPLERSGQSPTSDTKDSFGGSREQSSSSSSTDGPPRDTPSVQADDIHQQPSPSSPPPLQAPVGEQPFSVATTSSTTTTSSDMKDRQNTSKSSTIAPTPTPSSVLPGRLTGGRPKRPSLGFHGQAIRGRAHHLVSSSDVTPSSSPDPQPIGRSRDTGTPNNNQAPNGSINGIRRPGLSGGNSAASTSSTPLPAINGEPVASAFQNRLANANLRLRNRFKHRNQQHAAVASSANSTQTPLSAGNSSLAGPSIVSLVPPTEGGSNHLLHVATIERPVALVGGPPSSAGRPDEAHLTPTQSLNNPAVGSDEVLISAASLRTGDDQPTTGTQAAVTSESEVSLEPVSPEQQAGLRALSRAGEQRPSETEASQGGPRVLSGALQQGQLSSGPLNLDALFQSDQPLAPPGTGEQQQASEQQASHLAKESTGSSGRPALSFSPAKKSNHNEKLNGWLGHHHNRFVPRPAPNSDHPPAGHLSHQLAASLGGGPASPLSPSFSSHIPASASTTSPASQIDQLAAIKSTPVLSSSQYAATTMANDSMKPSVGMSMEELAEKPSSLSANGTSNSAGDLADLSQAPIQLQTITKTYSTIMTSAKTRLVPLQVKSSTAIHTITEQYIITKLMTAYQTIPAGGEFILTEPLSTRAPFELFNETPASSDARDSQTAPATQSNALVAPASGEQVLQEQPISLDPSPKSANDWLHDFSNNNDNDRAMLQHQQQQQLAASLLEQQARDANSLAALGFPSGTEPLDQLASTLDPAALLADGTINIPDLNNPIVLAAAIQNPQLAAVILAAQQLQLKQRQNKLSNGNNSNNLNQQQIAAAQLQPSYSTSLSTTIKQSTYTVRDTMYTTRLVSFKDGRTVRTRTVSEPGSVIEQVLTTMATEVTPVTITIRPTAPLGAPLATAALGSSSVGGPQASSSSQSTINNALFAAQLASLLARRQQQLQPSLGPQSSVSSQLPLIGNSATPQQLLAFQQLLQQQQRTQAGAANQQQAKQFQPNLQQLLQSMQQQQSPTTPNASNNGMSNSAQQPMNDQTNRQQAPSSAQNAVSPTPALPVVPSAINVQPTISGPITTTLTSLQVRTYTVHNAFKTIYRTITSTQLLTSTIYPVGFQRSTTMPSAG